MRCRDGREGVGVRCPSQPHGHRPLGAPPAVEKPTGALARKSTALLFPRISYPTPCATTGASPARGNLLPSPNTPPPGPPGPPVEAPARCDPQTPHRHLQPGLLQEEVSRANQARHCQGCYKTSLVSAWLFPSPSLHLQDDPTAQAWDRNSLAWNLNSKRSRHQEPAFGWRSLQSQDWDVFPSVYLTPPTRTASDL